MFTHVCVGVYQDVRKLCGKHGVHHRWRNTRYTRGGLTFFSHLKTEASLHLIYTLTTVLVWKSRSFILCYSLVIDATLNWRRVRVSTLKTHITRERLGILFLRLEYILLNDIHNEFIICIWATSSLLWCLPNGPGVISKTCRHFPASLTPKCILNIIPGNAII